MNKNSIWLLLTILFIFFLYLNQQNPLTLWDENAYLSNARNMHSFSYYQEDFRFPLLEHIIAGIWLFTGENLFIARLVMILISVTTVYFFHKIAEHYFKEKAIYATLLFSLCPLFLKWGIYIYPNIVGLLLITIAYHLYLKDPPHAYYWIGILSGLAFLTRFPLALFPLAIGITLLTKKQYKNASELGIGFFLPIVPWLLFNMIHYGNPLWDVQAQWTIVSRYTIRGSPLTQLINAWNMLNILIMFIPFGVYALIKNKKHESAALLSYLALFVTFFFFIANLKLERYYFAALTFIYLIVFFGIRYVLNMYKNKRIKTLIQIIVLVSVAIALSKTPALQPGIQTCKSDLALHNSINYVENNSREGDRLLSNTWPWYGYYNNLNATALWTKNVSLLIQTHHPRFIIHNTVRGAPYPLDLLMEAEQQGRLKKETTILGICRENITIYRVIK